MSLKKFAVMSHLNRLLLRRDQYPTRDHYPFNLPLLQQTPAIEFRRAVTFFVGENGTGKSTLLEAIAHRCRIHIWRPLERRRVEHNPYEQRLPEFIDVEWADGPVPGSFFASQIFRHFAELLDDLASADPGQLKYFGGKSLVSQSHGESLMSYFTARYKIRGLYFLDEPETALSPTRQVKLLKLFEAMAAGGHAQFIVATHSPILLACPGATIYSFDHVPVRQLDYEDTEHYQVYKAFLADRGPYLNT